MFDAVAEAVFAATLVLVAAHVVALVRSRRDSRAAAGRVLLRIPWAVAAAQAAWTTPLIAIVVLTTLRSPDPGQRAAWPWWLGAWLLAASACATLPLGLGVTLAPDGLTLRGLRRRHLAWSQISAIRRYDEAGAHLVVVQLRDGHRRRLRAPVAFLGVGRRRFDADFVTLGQWFMAYAPVVDGRAPAPLT